MIGLPSPFFDQRDPGDENDAPTREAAAATVLVGPSAPLAAEPLCKNCGRVLFGEWIADGLCKHCHPDLLEAI